MVSSRLVALFSPIATAAHAASLWRPPSIPLLYVVAVEVEGSTRGTSSPRPRFVTIARRFRSKLRQGTAIFRHEFFPMNESTPEPRSEPANTPRAPTPTPAGKPVELPPTGSLFLKVFPSIMLPMFLAVADQTIVATALPAIASSLGEIERASWVVVSYLIANTIAAPVYGRLGDTFGRRAMMFVALAIFMIGSVLCALAPNITLLTLFRVLQGFGGGGLMTLSQALIGEAVPPRERGRYQGYLAGIAVSSNTFGPVAGGFLTQTLGWQSIFLINIPLGLLAMAFVFRIPPRQGDRRRTTFDSPGLVLFIFFVGPVILALEQVQRMELSTLPMAFGLLAFGIFALVALLWQEQRNTAPLLPPRLFRNPSVWR